MGFRHIVVFRLWDDVTPEQLAGARASLESLTRIPGLLEATVAESLDRRKGRLLVENFLFESEAAYRAFQTSPAHRTNGELLAGLSDWLVADYLE